MKGHSAWWVPLAVALAAVVEVSVRSDLPSRAAALGFALAVATALGFRRTQPLAATAFAFGLATLHTLVWHHLGLPDVGPASAAAILLLPYSLCRRASLRQVIAGAAFVFVTWLASVLTGQIPNLQEAIGSAVVLVLPGTVGAVVRFRDEAQTRAVEHARLLEREQLARELHDSVAHHTAAITLQAQAARAVLRTSPDDAAEALAAIEAESKLTLVELRAIVGALREDSPLGPVAGLAQIRELGRASTRPAVEVTMGGDLEGLTAVLERALFRLAQEAVTNAIKHARNASTVRLQIEGDTATVRLSARDDGEPAVRGRAGFGLEGMAERVALLGGTFEAGPLPERGWRVEAVLPRERVAR